MNFKIEFENGGCEKRKRCPRVGFPGNRPRVRDGGEVRIFLLFGTPWFKANLCKNGNSTIFRRNEPFYFCFGRP